jgi:replicative DNA helicase
VDAERALVARLLLDPSQIPLIASELSHEDFFVDSYAEAFKTMVRLSSAGKAVDIVTLQAAGADVDPLDLTGAHHGALTDYAAIIRQDAFRRKVLAAVDRVARAAEYGDGDLMSTLQSAFVDLSQESGTSKLSTSSEAVDDYLEQMTRRLAGERTGLTFGSIPGLDNVLLPAEPGDLIILAARPGVGKSAMALALANHWAALGDGPVLFVSLEMKRKKILDRLVARVSGVSSQKLILGDVTPEEEASVREGLERIRQLPIVYLDDRYSTTATVRSMAARVAMQKGKLSAIVVDYIALLNDPGDQEVQRIARITGNLKSLAGEADCPVLALSQLNRQVEFRADKHPILSDLRDSGAGERDADTGIAPTDLDPMMDVEVLKQRQGNTSRIRVRFDGNTTSFHAPGPWSEPEAAPSAEEEPALTW